MTKASDRWGFKFTEEIFEYLKPVATRGQIVFYSTVASDVGGSRRSMGSRELAAIHRECEKHGWPPLNVLVVGKVDGLPGYGYTVDGHPMDEDEFEELKQEVCNFNWSDKFLCPRP